MIISNRTLRILEITGRWALNIAVIAFIILAFDTQSKINHLEYMIRNGNCTYLVEQGVIEKGSVAIN